MSLVGAWTASHSIIAIIVVAIVLDLATQTNLVLGQTRLIALSGAARSRLNTAIVVCNFLGDAVGSVIAGPLWAFGGWTAIMVAALAITLASLIIWAASLTRLSDAN